MTKPMTLAERARKAAQAVTAEGAETTEPGENGKTDPAGGPSKEVLDAAKAVSMTSPSKPVTAADGKGWEDQPMPPVDFGEPALIQTHTIRRDPENTRGELGDLTGLIDSIRGVGLLEPITVRALLPEELADDEVTWQVVYGNRRHAAIEALGLTVTPSIVKTSADGTDPGRDWLMMQVVENVQREDLTPLEEAAAYKRLTDAGVDQVTIARTVGRSQGHVSKRLALLKLPEEARQAVASEELPIEAAVELAKLPTKTAAGIWKSAQETRDWDRRPISEVVSLDVKAELDEQAFGVKRKALIAELRKEGKTVVDPKTIDHGRDAKAAYLGGNGYGNLKLRPKDHEAEPCHAYTVDEHLVGSSEPKAKVVCTDLARHKRGGDSKLKAHRNGYEPAGSKATKGETAEQKAAREFGKRGNAEWAEVTERRRAFLQALTRKPPKGDVAELVTIRTLLSYSPEEDVWVEEWVTPADLLEWFGLDKPKGRGASAFAAVQAFIDETAAFDRIAMAAAVIEIEAALGREAFDHRTYPKESWEVSLIKGAQPYFDWLERRGWELAPVELLRLGKLETLEPEVVEK